LQWLWKMIISLIQGLEEYLSLNRKCIELVVCGKSAGTMGISIHSFMKIIARHTKRVGNTRRPCFIPGTTVGSMIRVKS
jgi:hypothetical protein